MNEKRKVVITGIGLITPGADTLDTLWDRVISGNPYIKRIPELEKEASIVLGGRERKIVGARFDEINLGDHLGGKIGQEKLYDKTTKLAMVSSQRAVHDSKIGSLPKDTIVIYGSARGNINSFEDRLREIHDAIKGTDKLRNKIRHVRGASLTSTSMISPAVSRYHSLDGLTLTVGTACTSSLSALKLAHDYIKMGETNVALTGGSEAALTVSMYVWFDLAGLYSSAEGTASNAIRPFCSTRDGTALSEGSCTFVLEEENHARERGATIYGGIVAASTAIDPNTSNFESMSDDGIAYGTLIQRTLEKARVPSQDIGMIAAHAPGTKGDAIEIRALDHVFTGKHPKTVSFKSITGHSMGACGALETALALKALNLSYVPANQNIVDLDNISGNQNIPLEGSPQDLRYILKTGSGFGGYIGAIVLKRYQQEG